MYQTLYIILYSIYVLCFIIQLSYWLFVKRKLLIYDTEQNKSVTDIPFSIIVAAKNEAKNLSSLIPSLLGQEGTRFEVIVIDDQSTDTTSLLLKKYADTYAHFRYKTLSNIPEAFNSKKYALDTGIRMAKHENIILTDADCMPSSNRWAQILLGKMAEGSNMILGVSHYIYKKSLLNLIIRFETLQTMISYLSFALSGVPYMGVGRNLAYKKQAFISFNGFGGIENIVGGDDDLLVQKMSKAYNVSICIDKEAICYSHPKTDFLSYIKQKKRHLSVGKYYLPKFKFLLTLDGVSNMFFYTLFLLFVIIDKLSVLLAFLFVSKLLISSFAMYKAKLKVGAKISFIEIILMDVLNSYITSILGGYSVLVKNKKWN